MPVLIIHGVTVTRPLPGLIAELQGAVGRSLALPASEVSVFFPADLAQDGLGEELVCIVEGFFEKSERTPAVRQRVAEAAMSCLVRFTHVFIPACTKVEVIVKRFNQEVDGFAICDPRK